MERSGGGKTLKFFRNIESCHERSWSGLGAAGFVVFGGSRAVLCCFEVTCSLGQRSEVRSSERSKGETKVNRSKHKDYIHISINIRIRACSLFLLSYVQWLGFNVYVFISARIVSSVNQDT